MSRIDLPQEHLNKFLDQDIQNTLNQVRSNVTDVVSRTVDEYIETMTAQIETAEIGQLPVVLQKELNEQVKIAKEDLAILQNSLHEAISSLNEAKVKAANAGTDTDLGLSLTKLGSSLNAFNTALKDRQEKLNSLAQNLGKTAVKGVFGLIGI